MYFYEKFFLEMNINKENLINNLEILCNYHHHKNNHKNNYHLLNIILYHYNHYYIHLVQFFNKIFLDQGNILLYFIQHNFYLKNHINTNHQQSLLLQQYHHYYIMFYNTLLFFENLFRSKNISNIYHFLQKMMFILNHNFFYMNNLFIHQVLNIHQKNLFIHKRLYLKNPMNILFNLYLYKIL